MITVTRYDLHTAPARLWDRAIFLQTEEHIVYLPIAQLRERSQTLQNAGNC